MTTMAADMSAGPSPRSLIDPVVVRDLLQDALGPEAAVGTVRDVRIERCWPGNGNALRFQWSFTLDGHRRYSLYGAPMRPADVDGPALTNRPPDGPRGPGVTGVRAAVPHLSLTIHSPDRDSEMTHLEACLDSKSVSGRLAGKAGPPGAAGRPACTLLGYKPGRRAAIRYELGNTGRRKLVGKTYRDGRASRLAAVHEVVAAQVESFTGGRVVVPRAAKLVPELHLVLFIWSEGRRMLEGASADRHLPQSLEALAALHRVKIPGLPLFTIRQECETLGRWLNILRLMWPDRAAAFEPLFEALVRASGDTQPGPGHTIHRDFYEKQLIRNGQRTTLLDLDTLARGDACLDLGNLIAHLLLHRLHTGGGGGFGRLAEAVVERYSRLAGPVDRRTVAVYTASSLLRVGALHAVRTSTGKYAPGLWACAGRILAAKGARPFRGL